MFMVLKTTAVPDSLTGYLSRYLYELDAGLFVGKVNARLAEVLWSSAVRWAGTGHVVGVLSGRSELGFELRVHNHPELTMKDMDGVVVPVRRHSDPQP